MVNCILVKLNIDEWITSDVIDQLKCKMLNVTKTACDGYISETLPSPNNTGLVVWTTCF